MNITIPSRFGRVLAVVAWVLAAFLLATTAAGGAGVLLRYGWLPLLLAWVGWACFWSPSVTVADGGITLRNVLRTVRIPWPAIRLIDTKYSLTLHTADGKFSAWAAPAPSRFAVMRADRGDVRHLPESSYVNQSVRPGDLTSSESGQAAYLIRRRWEQMRDAGRLEAGTPDQAKATARWHWFSLAALLVLLLGTVLGLLL